MNTHWIERLSEYHDGELSTEERAACEQHLARCERCQTVLDEIRDVVRGAGNDPNMVPTVDLWPGILQRIASPNAGALSNFETQRARASARAARQITFTIPQLALAASLLIAVSAGAAYLLSNRLSLGEPAPEQAVQAMAEPMMAPSAEVTPASFADAQFDRAVADLEQILRQHRDELDPRTVLVMERNLAAIDEAIRQARAALDADPANTFLNSHLAAVRRRKLDLLREVATISSEGD